MFRVRQLRYALAVQKKKTFSGAAKYLHVSQSSVSEQIMLLEEELGFDLFIRSARGVELTDLGRIFLSDAEQLVTDAGNLYQRSQLLKSKSAESFRIGVSSGLTHLLVDQGLREMPDSFPEIRMEIVTTPTRNVYGYIHDEIIDFGLAVEVSREAIPNSLQLEAIRGAEMMVAAPRGHPLSRKKGALSVADLQPYPLIINELSLGFGTIVQSIFREAKFQPHLLGIVDNIETMKEMVSAGLGIAIVPSQAQSASQSNSSVRFKKLSPTTRVPICLIRRRYELSKAKEDYFSYLKDALS